ncbi:hypothetical protein LSAT2_021412, partial [Lamellibrachia satsuma]
SSASCCVSCPTRFGIPVTLCPSPRHIVMLIGSQARTTIAPLGGGVRRLELAATRALNSIALNATKPVSAIQRCNEQQKQDNVVALYGDTDQRP